MVHTHKTITFRVPLWLSIFILKSSLDATSLSYRQGWKERLLSATEEDTLVARGFFGPMRFIRNARALDLAEATLRAAPDLYKGIPTGSSREILDHELGGLANLFNGDIENTHILGAKTLFYY